MRSSLLVLLLLISPVHAGFREMSIVAHRGDVSRYPENSMAALRGGWRAGATYCEVDVRATADGVPVLLHDTTLDRTTALSGPLANLALADLGGILPTLGEAMLAAVAEGGGLVLHLKEPGSYPAVRALLERLRPEPERAILFLDGINVPAGNAAFSGLPYARWSDVATRPGRLADHHLRWYRDNGVDTLSFAYWSGVPSPGDVALVKAAGLGFAMYTPSGGGDLADAHRAGADYYMTNFPGRNAFDLRRIDGFAAYALPGVAAHGDGTFTVPRRDRVGYIGYTSADLVSWSVAEPQGATAEAVVFAPGGRGVFMRFAARLLPPWE